VCSLGGVRTRAALRCRERCVHAIARFLLPIDIPYASATRTARQTQVHCTMVTAIVYLEKRSSFEKCCTPWISTPCVFVQSQTMFKNTQR
jgi:hypothetical protein